VAHAAGRRKDQHRSRDPGHAPALRRLRLAAEEAKIEAERAAEAPIFISGLDLGDASVDVDTIVPAPTTRPRSRR